MTGLDIGYDKCRTIIEMFAIFSITLYIYVLFHTHMVYCYIMTNHYYEYTQ